MNDHLISRSRFLDALVLDADNKTDLIQVHQALEKAVISPDEVRGVVKCKDCTFGESATDGDGNPCVLCGNSMVFDYPYAHDPDWFCADGEMKGAEDGTTD